MEEHSEASAGLVHFGARMARLLTALYRGFRFPAEVIQHGVWPDHGFSLSLRDPDIRLDRKAAAREAKLSYMGHVTMENRHGLAVGRACSAGPTAPQSG